MYKRITLDELLTLQTGFFQRLQKLQSKEGHQFFSGFLKSLFDECNRTYFFERSRPSVRIVKEGEKYRFVDEVEKIDLRLDKDGVQRLHNILKDTGKMRAFDTNQSILESLLQQYREGKFITILGKPFIVYDIETTFGAEIKGQHFEMAYSIDSLKDHSESLQYDYVDRKNMKTYADELLEYDGWIIGYNSFSFDNPVLLENTGHSKASLQRLHAKSLDPFLLLWKLTGRRMSLNNVAQALIGSGKTLHSGAEGAEYLKKWKETGQEKYLIKVKEYCLNDVEITLGLVLYILHYQKIHLDGKEYTIDNEIFERFGGWGAANKDEKSKETPKSNQGFQF